MPDLQTHASPLLAVDGLAFSRNDTPVFGPLSFAVEANEALLVQGGNGAGKTTLLRVLAGLLRPDAGHMEIDGLPARPELRARFVAYLGHLPGLKADLSALHNLEFLCGLHGRRPCRRPRCGCSTSPTPTSTWEASPWSTGWCRRTCARAARR